MMKVLGTRYNIDHDNEAVVSSDGEEVWCEIRSPIDTDLVYKEFHTPISTKLKHIIQTYLMSVIDVDKVIHERPSECELLSLALNGSVTEHIKSSVNYTKVSSNGYLAVTLRPFYDNNDYGLTATISLQQEGDIKSDVVYDGLYTKTDIIDFLEILGDDNGSKV